MVIFLLVLIVCILLAPELVRTIVILAGLLVFALVALVFIGMLLGGLLEFLAPVLRLLAWGVLLAILAYAAFCICDAIYTQSRRLKNWLISKRLNTTKE